MPYLHTVSIDRKTGKILDVKVTPTDLKPNHAPLANHILDRMEQEEKEGVKQ